jgi:phosphatidylserine decarboxylase
MPGRDPITYFNRHTGRIETEAVYGEAFLRLAYETAPGRMLLHALIKRAFFSQWYGRRMDSPASSAKIMPFIEKFGVDTAEFACAPQDYRTFNEFFARKLRPEARPVDSRVDSVVFPADGRHLVIPDVSVCGHFFIKGQRFDIASLLGNDAPLVSKFARGSVLISRLCPTDYHRFHFPCAGVPDEPRLLNGPLFSVSPIALRVRPTILWENKRFLTRLRSDDLGEVLLMEIGATNVGSVTHTSTPHLRVTKGDEKGFFRFGGSSFITIFEPDRIRFADDLLEHSAHGREVFAKMGDHAATRINP